MSEHDTRRASVEIGWHETVRVMRGFLCPEAPLRDSINDVDLEALAGLIETARQRLREKSGG